MKPATLLFQERAFLRSVVTTWLQICGTRKRNATFSSCGTMRNIYFVVFLRIIFTRPQPGCGIDKKLNFQPISWALINILRQTPKVEFYLCLFHSSFIKVSDNRTTQKKKTSRFDKRVTRMFDSLWTHSIPYKNHITDCNVIAKTLDFSLRRVCVCDTRRKLENSEILQIRFCIC